VGDMTPVMQSKVLRVLQEGRFERVGGNNTIETDIRVIAATNRDLERMVAEGQFRADLYYRLNVFSVQLPPLRERLEDVPLLVDYFVGSFSRELGKGSVRVSPEALSMLMRYSWPGNVRELQSVLKRAMLRATGPVLMPEYLPDDVVKNRGHASDLERFVGQRLQAGSSDLHAEATAFMERLVLTKVLKHTAGNRSQAAKILSITRGTLRSKIRELGITIQQAMNVDAGVPENNGAEPAASSVTPASS
jgi:transcriptional regulator with GAF, ATPase, and Fis domain